VDHGRHVDRRKPALDEIELVRSQQRRPDRLDLHVGERFADAAMAPGAERDIAELLLAARALHVHEPARNTTTTLRPTQPSIPMGSVNEYITLH